MIRLLSLFTVSLVILSGCAATPAKPHSGSTDYTPIRFEGQTATSAERAKCEAVGGVVRRAGLAGFENCIQTLPDAGKTCAGESDCIARCIVDGSDEGLEFGTKITGICEMTDSPFGCTPLVENGEYAGTLCVD